MHGGEVGILGEWNGIPTMSRDGSTRMGSTTPLYGGTHRWLDGRAKDTTDDDDAFTSSQGRRLLLTP